MGKRRNVKPTIMQIKALTYINQGMSKRAAMIKAGYSPGVANTPNQNLMQKVGVKYALESMKTELVNQGLTVKYVTAKLKEFFEAKKVNHSPTGPDTEVPDYNTQMKAFDRWKDAFNEDKETAPSIKRKMTITEFVMGDKEG